MEAQHGEVVPCEATWPGRCTMEYIRIKNLPSEWTEEVEKAQQTLKDLLETCSHLKVSHVTIKRTYLYQPREGTKQQSFAHVWLHGPAAQEEVLRVISTLTVQGTYLKATWPPKQPQKKESPGDEGAQDPVQHPRDQGLPQHPQELQDNGPRGSGLNRTGDYMAWEWQQRIIPEDRNCQAGHYNQPFEHSKWPDTEAFQAILLGDNRILLTTFSMARNETLTIEASKVRIIGAMWSYEAAYRREAWIAHAEHEDIEVTHEKARGILINKWIGFHCQIQDPENIHIVQVSSRESQVFVRTRPDQIVTCIAPPYLGMVRHFMQGRCVVYHCYHLCRLLGRPLPPW